MNDSCCEPPEKPSYSWMTSSFVEMSGKENPGSIVHHDHLILLTLPVGTLTKAKGIF